MTIYKKSCILKISPDQIMLIMNKSNIFNILKKNKVEDKSRGLSYH